MIKNNCEHEWEQAKGAEKNSRDPSNSPMLKCNKCNTLLPASIVFQLEALNNQTKEIQYLTGFQKWLSILAFIVSIFAVFVAWLK